MATPDPPDDVRIGTAERDAALSALQEHLTAGRIELDEFDERAARATQARTRSELQALFADLPQPHAFTPAIRPASPAQQRSCAGRTERRDRRDAARRSNSGNPLFGRAGETVVALSPFIALVLFFTVVHVWWVFLLIPAAGALIYGRGGRHHDG
jgi:hypothetical protein